MSTNLSGTYTFPGGGYKYLCIPETFPDPTKITLSGLDVAMAGAAEGYGDGTGPIKYKLTPGVTNTFGNVTVAYKVFRSLNVLNGQAIFIVS